MSVRMHRSSDGMMRPCDAKTPESCKATGPDGSTAKHYMFDSPQAANQWNALSISYSMIPRSKRREPPAIELLTAMSSLQNGGPAATALEVARLQESVNASKAGTHNSLGKQPPASTDAGDEPTSDANADPDSSTADSILTEDEKDSIRQAAASSGTGSPRLDEVDLSTFASKLKTDGYSREMDEDYPYSIKDLPAKAKDMLLDENWDLAATVASTRSYAYGKTDSVDLEAEEAICDAYEQIVGLDAVLPLNARRDLRKIASKWALASKVGNVTLADRMNMTYSHIQKTLDEYSIIIDGLSPVINSRAGWTNKSWQAKQRSKMTIAE